MFYCGYPVICCLGVEMRLLRVIKERSLYVGVIFVILASLTSLIGAVFKVQGLLVYRDFYYVTILSCIIAIPLIVFVLLLEVLEVCLD